MFFAGKEEASGVQLVPASFANFCVSFHILFRLGNSALTDIWQREEPFHRDKILFTSLWWFYFSPLRGNRHPSQESFFLPTKYCAVQNIDICEQFRHLFINVEVSRYTVNQKRVKMIKGTWQCSQWLKAISWTKFFLRARGHCRRQRSITT